MYDLPFFHSAKGVKRVVLDGWGVSGVTIFQSGTPFSIYDSGAGTAFLGAGSTPLLGADLPRERRSPVGIRMATFTIA